MLLVAYCVNEVYGEVQHNIIGVFSDVRYAEESIDRFVSNFKESEQDYVRGNIYIQECELDEDYS